jgi:predicted lysophospholipase L1 biosynthesis ABC-type transport system permease subunit
VPGAPGEVALGDVDTLLTALTAARPGSARVNEVWLGVSERREPAVRAALGRPPFRALETVSRRALEADARRDPLAHGTLLALLGAALVALALAVTGLSLAVLADLRDERGELLDLEAEGASPPLLRRVVRLRALVVAAFGLVGGLITGAVLAGLVTDVVSVTARARAPEPPLELSLDPLAIGLAALAYVVLAAGLVVLATRRAFSAATA